MQSKKLSHIEVVTNQIAGIVIGWLITYYILPLLGIPFTATQSTVTTLIFFVASYIRMYALRRFFNQFREGRNAKEEKEEPFETSQP